MQELQEDKLAQLLQENEKVVVQYGASWCGACRMMKPQFRSLGESEAGVLFLYVDAEKFPQSRSLAKVDNLPTFVGFVKGEAVQYTQGTKIEALKELVNEVASH